jgi:hypothetical protein
MKKAWGEATALFDRSRKLGLVEVLVVIGLAGVWPCTPGSARASHIVHFTDESSVAFLIFLLASQKADVYIPFVQYNIPWYTV